MDNDQGNPELSAQEEARKQRILAQKKEKKIKIIRILTVIAYLICVSTAAVMLSAYYIFVWNPHAGNSTQTPNTEGLVMALQSVNGDYVFANNVHQKHSNNRNFVTEILNSRRNNRHITYIKTPEESIQYQTTVSIGSSTTHREI